MAPLDAGSAGLEVLAEEMEPVAPFSTGRARRRIRWWRGVVLTVTAAFFLIPVYAGLRFSLEDVAGGFSFSSIGALPQTPGFTAALWLSTRLAIVTVVIAVLLMVPTTVYVHLRLPRLRRLLDFVTVLPIVIPPIILIAGVLAVAPLWLKSSPYLLSLMYVILAMPFIYRSLDAGLLAIDLKTLYEASRSLGGRSISTLTRVILPNIRPALVSATVLTLAMVFGEYTMASLDLWTTVPVWIVQTNGLSNGHIQIAAAMLGLVVTWVLLTVIVSLDRSQRRRVRG
jgi:putative spermidine/putrescine transport system permease protein